MPFRGVSLMDQRGAFVSAARIAGANVRELCRTYAISPTTGYKWLDRAGVGAAGGLADRSRRPHRSPRRTAAELEAAVVAVRLEHPRWGGRKIHHFLKLERIVAPPHPHTQLTAWLMRLGIGPVHGRPYHPQTQGKNERFNRTLKAELIADRSYAEPAAVQADFDRWRAFYNHRRPHQAIGDVPPAYRFRASERAFPERLPAIEYRTGLAIRRVQVDGRISFASRAWFVTPAFGAQQVALQPAARDGLFKVLFCTYHVGEIDLAKRP